jgi:hypothetical protein
VPLGFQPPPERREVVNLTVEDGPDRAGFVGKRLMGARHVDDRQPPKAQRSMVVAINTRVVRSAVDDPVHHGGEIMRSQRICRIRPDRATDAAHIAGPHALEGEFGPKILKRDPRHSWTSLSPICG